MDYEITLRLTTAEYQELLIAARKAKLPPEQYAARAVVESARKKLATKTTSPEETGRQRAFIGAYEAALRYRPAEAARTAAEAARLAKLPDRRPEDLAAVLAWIRQRVPRYRQGHVPLGVIAGEWPAWLAQRPAASAPPVATTTLAPEQRVFGVEDDEW